MARPPRGSIPAGTYHVWRRTCGPVLMFKDDTDRTDFCNRLTAVVRRYGWIVVAFVLMPTHFHFVLELLDDDVLQPGMHRLFGGYAQQFNRRWSRSGHLKGEQYKHRPIYDDRDLLGVVRYVARNPVRDGLCETPQDWRWSSYAGSAGYRTQFPFMDDRLVMEALHPRRAEAQEILRFVVEAEDRGNPRS